MNAETDAVAVDIALPFYDDAELARLDEAALVARLREDGDRAPRNLINTCAARGDAMVQILQGLIEAPDFPDEYDDNAWWLGYHAAMIAGLVPTKSAGNLLIRLMQRLNEVDDFNMQDWLSGYWPALFANKPATLSAPMKTLAEEPSLSPYLRPQAAEVVVFLAHRSGEEQLEGTLDWLASLARDEQQEWTFRLLLGHTLLDFPRERHRPLLEALAARQMGLGRSFDSDDIERAHTVGKDKPAWERFPDPWRFYEPATIEARQRRWAEEDRRHAAGISELFDSDISPEPYVRPDPKIGRNDPCPCGSGKKYKKCCLGKTEQ